MKKIVVIEDDQMLQEELLHLLKKQGYHSEAIKDFKQDIVAQILALQPDLVLLDINLPYQSGFEICKQLSVLNRFPILILSSRDKLKDELHGLELGADDYLTKPFQPAKLLARIENLLRRFAKHYPLLQTKDFQLDPQTFILYKGNQAIVLNANEGKILQVLIEKAPEIVTKEALSQILWQTDTFIEENTLQVNITRLRKSLRMVCLEDTIETMRGKGYRLTDTANDTNK